MPESTFVDGGSSFCKNHTERESLMERASDAFSHGIYAKTIRHVFDKLSAWQKLVVLAFYDSYVQESRYDFEATLHDYTIDFGDFDEELPLEVAAQLEDNETLSIGVPVPTERAVRGFALYRAALKDMSASLAERETLPDEDTAAMERETVVSVTDEGREITDVAEHHLNMPISRVDNDREDLLRFGGVDVDGDEDVSVNVETPESLIVDLDDEVEPESTSSDANPVEEELYDFDGDGG